MTTLHALLKQPVLSSSSHTWGILILCLPCLSLVPSPLDSQEPITHLIDRDQWALYEMAAILIALVKIFIFWM